MSGKRYTEEQIIYALKRADGGATAKDICREMGVSEATFYVWRKKCGGLSQSAAARRLGLTTGASVCIRRKVLRGQRLRDHKLDKTLKGLELDSERQPKVR